MKNKSWDGWWLEPDRDCSTEDSCSKQVHIHSCKDLGLRKSGDQRPQGQHSLATYNRASILLEESQGKFMCAPALGFDNVDFCKPAYPILARA